MQALAGIFFQVYPVEPDIFFNTFYIDSYISAFANRCRMLGKLVPFWKIGVEIIFSGKIILLYNFAMTGQSHFYSKLNSFFIHLWQSAGMSQCNRAYFCIGRGSESIAVTAE